MALKMGPDGRVLVPAELRRQLGLEPGTTLAARVEDDRLILERRDRVLHRLQERFAAIPPGVSLVDELLEDRRREVQRQVRRTGRNDR
ncbi:MAG TPA: AbrB/MazE/SpoVT family DNA-binding domain-containing protein [candidate division Zixibacteria bacterium]|nr:AbrB/MazE/SpoVT family DNA-binding domain-containing protein [candidate division Zixibacteria bacterium]